MSDYTCTYLIITTSLCPLAPCLEVDFFLLSSLLPLSFSSVRTNL